MATGAHGEGIITAGDREVEVIFTNRVLMNVERQLGKAISAILDQKNFGYIELVALLRAGMDAARRDGRHGGGRSISHDDALQVIDEAGFGPVAGIVIGAVAAVVGYSPNSEDEAEDPN